MFCKIFNIFIFYCIFLITNHCFAASTNGAGKNIPQLLENGTILNLTPMRQYLKSIGKKTEFDGDVYFVEIERGIKAIFKALQPENIDDALAEVAAYKASKFLGFPNIPTTTLRTIDGKKGSIQLFIDTDIDLLAYDTYEKVLQKVSKEELAKLKLFYFVFGQWDTGPHNLLAIQKDGDTKLFAIDNSGIKQRQYVKYGELPFVRVGYNEKFNTNDWNKPFPFNKAKDKNAINDSEEYLQQTFKGLLPKGLYNKKFRYVIYNNSLYIQYHAFSKNFEKSYTAYYPKDAIDALKKLDENTLINNIFSHAKGAEFLTPQYLKSILKRRNQVLKKYQTTMSIKSKEDF